VNLRGILVIKGTWLKERLNLSMTTANGKLTVNKVIMCNETLNFNVNF